MNKNLKRRQYGKCIKLLLAMHNSYFTLCSISKSNNTSNCYRKDIRLSMPNTNQLPLRKFPASNELTLLRLFLLKSVFHTIKCDIDYLSGITTQFGSVGVERIDAPSFVSICREAFTHIKGRHWLFISQNNPISVTEVSLTRWLR